jgi:protocatechuate 3,4-dioxygenase beta subunit
MANQDIFDRNTKQLIQSAGPELHLPRNKKSQILARLSGAAPATAQKQKSILRIIMESRITKLAAAVLIIAGVLIGINVLDGTPAWADIVQAFNEVENVHLHAIRTMSDPDWEGTVQHIQIWTKRPHLNRCEEITYTDGVEVYGRTVVDNGSERLYLSHREKQAQLSESAPPFQFELDWWFCFQQYGEVQGYEITPLASESSSSEVQEGKLWVDAKTLLPQRYSYTEIEQRRHDESLHVTEKLDIKWSYEPIPDDFFSTEIPEGYTELPRVEPFSYSGVVIDEDGYAVEDAIVYAMPIGGARLQSSVTNANGAFVLRGADRRHAYYLLKVDDDELPGFLRAFRPDDPTRVAWTLFEHPEHREERANLGGVIPGDPGEAKIVQDDYRGADRIVLQLAPAAQITGTVIDEQGNPVPDVNVGLGLGLSGEDGGELQNKEGDPFHFSSKYDRLELGGPQIQTDDQGRYVLANLPRLWKNCYHGPYFEKEGYVLVSSGKAKNDGPLQDQTVDAQMYKKMDVTVKGRAVDNHGRPLIGYLVSLFGKDMPFGGARTDAEGYFNPNCSTIVEELKIAVGREGIDDWQEANEDKEMPDDYEFLYYPRTEVQIDYQPGKEDYHVEIVPERGDMTIEVVVKERDSSHAPIPDHPVQLLTSYRRGGRRYFDTIWQGTTNAEGVFVVENVPCPEEELRAFASRTDAYHKEAEDLRLIPGQKEYKVELTPRWTEKGRNRRSQGK